MLTEEAFKVIYDDYLESGLSIRSYCSNQRINEAKFFYWQRRLTNQLSPARGFVPLVIDNGLNNQRRLNPTSRAAQPDAGPDKASFCEITYPNGVTLKLLYISVKLTPKSAMLPPPEGFPEGPPRRAIVLKNQEPIIKQNYLFPRMDRPGKSGLVDQSPASEFGQSSVWTCMALWKFSGSIIFTNVCVVNKYRRPVIFGIGN